MKTLLLICAESEARVSDQFVDALIEMKVANQVEAIAFGDLELRVEASEGVDEVVVFPGLIALPDVLREDLLRRIQALSDARPEVGIHLANPLGSDPRLIEMVSDRMATALKGTQDAPILTVEGLDDSRTLRFEDLAVLPDQIPDVNKLVADRQGQGVWVRAVLGEVENADAVFYADDDRFSATVDLALVREYGLFIYGMDGGPLPASYGGPLRLMIPDHDDRCANVKGVARVEIVLR